MTTQQIEELARQVESLPSQQQREVADFVAFLKTRSRPRGTPGHTLNHLIGSIPSEDLKEIMDAVNEDCSQIDWERWK